MASKSRIAPYLWFDKEAVEASRFYTSVFKDANIKSTKAINDTPSGTTELVTMDLLGQEFMLISAGPLFKFNQSVSFLVACDTKDEVVAIWERLAEGGTPLMDLGAYPFSEKYGWVQDKYGLTWQVMFSSDIPIKQRIIPTLMFTGDVSGKARDALRFYASVFHNAKVGDILEYSKGEEPDPEGTIKHASFTLEGYDFAAMDSARVHNASFNEAVSFMVNCTNQEEIDYYWERLSADSKAEQCGWLKDKYGLSWQIVPTVLGKMLSDKSEKRRARVTETFLKMKKFDIAELERAYSG